MRISELLIENLGPITKISLTFGQRDKLQPIIIVGANGTGKSILLSVVADAMIEIAKKNILIPSQPLLV
ncbi:AAA family ATPase [Deinococcus sp.]|uniref:AAA family ATPase n=1 Tax=Deinococcus sp. TaxID=47478 RepID=UPI00286E3520|nr:AAA family ATPase [Deinococcus sp.]